MSKEGKESLPFFVEKRKEFMVKTIELRKPILINGVEIKQLTYDFDEISCEAYTKAFGASMSVALVSAQNGKPNANIMEQDGNLHLYLGMEAIIAINPDIDVADLERIKGFDLVQITRIGRNFISGNAEETSNQNDLGKESEVIPESITQESVK